MRFDVNTVLADLRAGVQEGLYRVYQEGLETEDTDLLRHVCELFDNLDSYLRYRGALPADWEPLIIDREV